MNKRADSLPRTPTEIQKTSLFSLRRHYSALLELYEECVRQRSASSGLATQRARPIAAERRSAGGKLKKQQKEIRGLTASALAAQQAKKSATWAAGAGVTVGVMYKVWGSVGFPGGRSMEFFWELPEVIAAMTSLLSILFAAAYRACHPAKRD